MRVAVAVSSILWTLAFLESKPTAIAFTPSIQLLRRNLLTLSHNKNLRDRLRLASDNTALFTSTNANDRPSTSSLDPYTSPKLDTDALTKYFLSGLTEISLFGATFQLTDLTLARWDFTPSSLPFPLVVFVFYAISLKSRIFNPLNNRRPDISKAMSNADGDQSSPGFRDRVMPNWTPPGFVFPIMWLLIIGPIRAYSSALVVTTSDSFLHPAIMAFILQLTIGDIWNTINNTEKRYGAAVSGVVCVVLSVINAAYNYYLVDPLAGKLLGGTAIWLVTAAALITDTWRLHPAKTSDGGENIRVPLWPVVGEAKTEFMWFSSREN